LTPEQQELLCSALLEAVGHASVFVEHGPLPNKVPGRGRPPDNAVLLFIDDIWQACVAAGLKPGLRYVSGTESLPVGLFMELSALMWGPTQNPRRFFERWQRHRSDLIRTKEV